MKQYAVCQEALEQAVQTFEMNGEDDVWDLLAPTTQHIEQQDSAQGFVEKEPDVLESYDFSEDLHIPSTHIENQTTLNELPDVEYGELVSSLNKEQKEFFYHILHLIKTTDKPFYTFLTDRAGVGKSHVTKALYQAVIKHLNMRAGDDFNKIRAILLAPTGKAAYNIQGKTIHSTFNIPANQNLKNYKSLDSSWLNTLRAELSSLKVIFLDEVSIVGSSMFTLQINKCLQDIMGNKSDFGGVSIVAIGDLFQLQPVFDRYLFDSLETP